MISSLRPISAAIGQAAGDLLAYNGTSWARLAAGVGENGKVLTVVAGVPAWVAPTVYDDTNVFYKDGSRNLTGVLVTSGQGIRPAANSTTAIQVQQADGTSFVNFDSTNKRVGIGSVAPAYHLVVEGTSPVMTVKHSAGSTIFLQAQATLGSFGTIGDFPFGFYANGSIRFYITSDGKIGIGGNLTSPTKDMAFGGNSARTIWLERHTTDATTGNNLTVQAGGCKAGQTNIGGGGLNLDDATGTGNAYGGGVFIRNYIAGVSGTSDNSQVTVFQARNNQIAWFAGTLVSQQSHIADPSGGATVDAEARSAINSILLALENYSLLKSS